MKLKKYYKYCLALCILLLVVVLTILANTNIQLFKFNKKTTNKFKEIDMALIVTNKTNSEERNQLTESLDECGDKYDKSYGIFETSNYGGSYSDTISAAAKHGANLIVCPDSSFEETIYTIQNSYTDVYFLLVDGYPHNTDYSDSTINFNVIPLVFDDAEAGFLAGYAAAYDGNKKISFIGLEDDTQSIRYFYGFLQGTDYAANELNVNDIKITVDYISSDNCTETANNRHMSGADLIVGCKNSVIKPLIEISKTHEKNIIICGDNQPPESPYIIANTTKNLYYAATDCISNFYDGEKIGGTIQRYNASQNAIALSFKSADFTHFDSKIYDSIYLQLSSGEIQLISDTTITPSDLELTNVTIVIS